jgi:hypothetical protein
LPWSEDGDFLEPVFRRQVRLLRAAGLENLYIFGTAGEGYAVTDPVFRQIATVFFDAMRGGSGLCQVGVIGLSVAQLRAMLRELTAIREKIIALVTQAGGHMDGAFDKVYARLLNPEFPIGLLSPYQGADEDVCEAFARWLEATLPAWAGESSEARQT